MPPNPSHVDPQEVAALCASLGFPLDDTAIVGLTAYLELLTHWNRAMNLVGVQSWPDAVRTLIIDSLHLAPFLDSLPLPASPLCWDLGAGAGLPGIPLRLIWKQGDYWMIEAREKRALFLSTVLARLSLPGTHVYRGRLEQFVTSHPVGRAPADLILSKAFMPWRELLAAVGCRLGNDGLIVLLLNEPLPDTAWAAPIGGRCWSLHSSQAYVANGTRRVVCAIQPEL